MAAVDTIEVLDDLQFSHLNTADIYTVHADSESGEAVCTRAVLLPMNCLAARVIVNNNYGATGSTVHARIRCTEVTGITTTTVTKVQNVQPLEWTSIALGSAVESSEINLTNVYEAMLHIDVAITGTTAHLGTEIIVQVRKEASVDEWTQWARFIVLSGLTAFKTDLSDTAASGQKVIPIANPTAGNLNHIMKHLFILDATVANCEIVFQTACGADT
jgi:hypothetical protein